MERAQQVGREVNGKIGPRNHVARRRRLSQRANDIQNDHCLTSPVCHHPIPSCLGQSNGTVKEGGLALNNVSQKWKHKGQH
jgi:hypothetical protein